MLSERISTWRPIRSGRKNCQLDIQISRAGEVTRPAARLVNGEQASGISGGEVVVAEGKKSEDLMAKLPLI